MRTKLTPEEKAAKKEAAKAAQREAKEKYKAEQDAYIAAYKAGLPARLHRLQELARSVDINVEIGLNETGPTINLEYKNSDEKIYIDTTLTYDSEEWEVEILEDKIKTMREELDAYNQRREVAQDIFSKLTKEEKAAIKEHIHYIK